MSIVPTRKLTLRPINLGGYSRAIVMPAWWLKLNSNPRQLELALTLNYLVARPAKEKTDETGENDIK
jgi:hypothetical protein